MAPNPAIMQAVEQLGYRVTVGDVATQAGLNVNLAQQGLLTLASDAGGHLQVAESGEIVYLFPKNFRTVLQNKFWRLRLQEWWQKVWRVLFYLIRISFGILLLVAIALIVIAIFIIITASNRDSDGRGDRHGSSGGGMLYMPYFWISPDWFWIFYPDYGTRYQQRRRESSNLNFFEAVFSFLFGDGNPNANLAERRWQQIAAVIRNNGGAVAAEQIAPYLDEIGEGYAREYEDYMLPVLTRFNGKPVVSPEGQIVYHFPELQVMASQRRPVAVPKYLEELKYRFSAASSGQIILSAGLGVVYFVLALVLGNLLADGTAAASIGGIVAFVQGIYWLLLGYSIAFLTVPLVRYFWIQWRNRKISDRNQQRQARARLLANADPALQQKIAYAHQFAAETVIAQEDLVYTTETDLLEQEAQRSDQIDAEWRRRLSGSSETQP
jgi:hypothetical protein